LGTGLSGPAHGSVAHAIERVNESAARSGTPVVALDLPSGLGSDGGAIFGPSVRATLTVTFGGYKRSPLLYSAAEPAGRILVASIGIPGRQVRPGITTFLLDERPVPEVCP